MFLFIQILVKIHLIKDDLLKIKKKIDLLIIFLVKQVHSDAPVKFKVDKTLERQLSIHCSTNIDHLTRNIRSQI